MTKITKKITKALTLASLSIGAIPFIALSCSKEPEQKPKPAPLPKPQPDPNPPSVSNPEPSNPQKNDPGTGKTPDQEKPVKGSTQYQEPKTPNTTTNEESLNMYELWDHADIGATFDKLLDEYKAKKNVDKFLKEMQNYGPNSNTENNYYLSVRGSGGKPETAILKLKEGFDHTKHKGTVPDKKERWFAAEFNETTRELKITYKYDQKEYTDTIVIPVAKNPSTTDKQEDTQQGSNSVNNKDANTTGSKNLNKEQLLSKHNENINKYNLIYDNSNNYYASLDGKTGQDLLNALISLQASHLTNLNTKSYDGLKSFYDQYNAFKDTYFENNNSILDVYSENPNGNDPYEYLTYRDNANASASNEGGGLNREHLIPQSWFNKVAPTVHDAHFVWPSDIKVNALRANYPHGNVSTTRTTTQNGSKLGTDANSKTVFEPVDAFKGDIARAYFYFMITHKDKLVASQSHIFTNSYSSDAPYIQKDYFNYYLEWDITDYVTKWDIIRNNETYKYQQNRNPFIDYPDLILKIIGDDKTPFTNRGILTDIQDK